MRLMRWLTRSGLGDGGQAPKEVVGLRLIAIGILTFYTVSSFVTEPRAGLGSGRSVVILLGTVVFIATAAVIVPVKRLGDRERLAGVLVMTAVAAGLVQLQPDGLWAVTPYLVGSVSAILLAPRVGGVAFGLSTAAILGSAVLAGRADTAGGILVGVIPWFLFMRVMKRTRAEHDVTKCLLRELEASRAAEALAAAENERARVAREMHDVLAHSLSSLALQLESTRLLAADRGTAPEVVDGISRAHGIAATGLEEARRAIGALRGDDLPGPDRLPALVDAFTAETGRPCALEVTGTPLPLPGDARLALYRTAQEALTNVRRHAPADGVVAVALDWAPQAVRLVVADRAPVAVPAGPAPASAGGGYGLTGMRERAELLGGRLVAGPVPGGFRVELELPA